VVPYNANIFVDNNFLLWPLDNGSCKHAAASLAN